MQGGIKASTIKAATRALVRDDQIQRSVNAIYWRQLASIFLMAAAYYSFLTIGHLFFMEGMLQLILVSSCVASVAVALGSFFLLKYRKFRTSRAPWLFVPTGLAIIVNVYLHVFLSQDQMQLTNGVLAVLAFGFVMLHMPMFIALTALSALLYFLALLYVPGDHGVHFGFMYVAALILAVISFWQRYNTIRSEVALSLLNKSRVRALSRLNTVVEEKADEARRANEAKSAFLANTTHELRTPLTGIIGMLELLRSTDLSSEQVRLVETAYDTSQSLKVLINDILDISRLSEGKLALQPRSFSPAELVVMVERLLTPKAEEKGLKLSVGQLPPDSLRAFGDPVRIGQVLTNLVGNAIKYTHNGRIVIDLQVSADVDRIALTYSVVDTGVGISDEDQVRLFERFERADSSLTTDHDGAGLGLAICKQLLDLMGGTISLESTLGQGSAFSFTVNVPAVDEIDIEQEAFSVAPQNDVSMLTENNRKYSDESSFKVLVAEDNPVNQMLIEKILAHDTWNITMVSNGQEAVDALQEKPDFYDLVLMDIRMPILNGVDAVKVIRSHNDSLAAMPIIALTANSAEEDVRTYIQSGFDDVVAKPIDMDALMAAITKVAS